MTPNVGKDHVIQTGNPSYWEAEAEGWKVQSQSGVHSSNQTEQLNETLSP